MNRIGRLWLVVAALVGANALPALAQPVSLEQAKVAAQAWAVRGGTLGETMGQLLEGGAAHETDEGARFYSVKTKNGGTVFLSADDTMNPILGFTGSTDDFTTIDRASPLWAMLEAAADESLKFQVSSLKLSTSNLQPQTSNLKPQTPNFRWTRLLAEGEEIAANGLPKFATSLKDIGDVRVPVIVESHWSQTENAYNYYTPNKYPCGCVATAMAQVMRYWCWPTASVTAATKTCHVDGVATDLTMKGGVYDWANMPLKYAGNYGDNYTATEKEAVGRLCYDAGVAVNMSYKSDGSGAYADRAVGALTNDFHYANAVYTSKGNGVTRERFLKVLEETVYPSLDARLPVMTEIPGHEIVADGYGYNDGIAYVHFNYGWGGSTDAWFSTEDLSVNTFVYNIMPENNTGAENPLNQAIISGRVTNRAGEPMAGVQVKVTGGGGEWSVITNTSEYGVWGVAVSTEGAATYDVTIDAGDAYEKAQITGVAVTKPVGYFSTVHGNSWGNDVVLDETSPSAITVGLYVGGGARRADLVHWQKTLCNVSGVTLRHVYAADIRNNANALSDLNLLVIPNGEASAQYAALKAVGRDRIVKYVADGGQILATGAGCELLLTGKNRLGLLPYQAKEGQSGRGRGYAKVDFTEEAQTALGVAATCSDTWFDNGPVLEESLGGLGGLGGSATVYGTVYASVMENGSKKVGMYGTPAAIYATVGNGKVFATTIEPQHFTTTRQAIAQGAIKMLTGKAVTLPSYGLPSYTGTSDKSVLIGKMATIGSTYTEPTSVDPSRLHVAYYCGPGGNGANNVLWAKTLNESPDVQLWIVNASDIAGGALAGKDVLVMPGGDSGDLYSGLGTAGQEAIRSYVQNGGKYYGTCAGTSLLLNASGRIAMIPYNRYSENPSRGGGMVVSEFSDSAVCASLGLGTTNRWSMAYHKGPVMFAKAGDGLAAMEVIATCGSEVQQFGEGKSAMYGSPAILRGTYGSGKLFLTNCHPEAYAETRAIVSAGFKDLTGRYITIPTFGPYAEYKGTSKEELVEAE